MPRLPGHGLAVPDMREARPLALSQICLFEAKSENLVS
jgi:hypothetical protein